MNRFLVLGLVGITSAVTAGCPIYSHDGSDCDYDDDCEWGRVCSSYGYCVVPSQSGGSGFVPAGYKGGGAGKAGSGLDGSVGTSRGGGPVSDGSSGGWGGLGESNDSGIAGALGGAVIPADASTGAGGAASGGAVGAGGAVASGGTAVGGAAASGGSLSGAGGSYESPDSGLVDVVTAPETGPETDVGATVYCGSPGDCAQGQTCTVQGVCVEGDCASHSCVNQFVCSRVDGGLACTLADPSACSSDRQCASSDVCIDGRCAPVSDLCTDQTQCTDGHVCADGRCVKSCSSDGECSAGYRCRPDLGICNIAVKGCVKTSDCGEASSVCVQNTCVPRCAAVGACNGTEGACVSNGCIPAQKTLAECEVDGDTSICGDGKICLHHHCYVSCEAPHQNACAAQYKYVMCKNVVSSSGTHAVCGSSENLGSECDATLGTACAAGKLCINGFCR